MFNFSIEKLMAGCKMRKVENILMTSVGLRTALNSSVLAADFLSYSIISPEKWRNTYPRSFFCFFLVGSIKLLKPRFQQHRFEIFLKDYFKKVLGNNKTSCRVDVI